MNAPSPPPRIASPCIKLCVIDQATRQCRGCHRTLNEIAGWSGFSPAEREAIMAELPARAATATNTAAQSIPNP